MALRRIPGVRQVPVKEIRELLKQSWVRDEELSTRASEARLLRDGRVLLYLGEGEKGTIFPSRASLAEVRREGEEMMKKGGSTDLTLTLLPPVADFLRDVEAHAKSLGKAIRVPDEALDGTEASLGAVDAALRRIRLAKRMTPEIVTPLVAYVGQVMLGVCGGTWTRGPTSRRHRVPVHDPAELAAWQQAWAAAVPAIKEAQARAAADARARRASEADVLIASRDVLSAAWARANAVAPKPIRVEVFDEPITGSVNAPLITARDGRLLEPFHLVVVPMVEPSKRCPLQDAVAVTLHNYRPGRAAAGSSYDPPDKSASLQRD